MRLAELINEVEYEVVSGSTEIEISEVVYDSRKAVKNSAFVCIIGTTRDSHDFIPQVVESGATAIIVEKDDVIAPEGVTVIRVQSSRKALAYMAAAYFGHPAKELKMIGLTGTKGKTTTSYRRQGRRLA